MKLLNHKFGNDGMFWISYEDLLRNYSSFDRTRLFGPDWRITQQWTTVSALQLSHTQVLAANSR